MSCWSNLLNHSSSLSGHTPPGFPQYLHNLVGALGDRVSYFIRVDTLGDRHQLLDRIQGRLAELKEYIVANVSDPTSDQLEHIETNLKYLSEAVDRLRRRDWLGVLIGILLNIMFTVPAVQTAAQNIFHFAMYGITPFSNTISPQIVSVSPPPGPYGTVEWLGAIP